MKKQFVFTVDDNIRFLKELSREPYDSIFSHPYMAMYKRLHEKFGLKIQLNLFYLLDDFDLSQTSEKFRNEWNQCSGWLKLSFHSKLENRKPYEHSGYDEVYEDCQSVHREILRFAGDRSLAKTTTVHYCVATDDGLRAISDNGVCALLGLFGTADAPRTSYGLEEDYAKRIRAGETVCKNGMYYSGIDIVLNNFKTEEILASLAKMTERDVVRVMIHEQYFYSDYHAYQKNFEEKLFNTFECLTRQGRECAFFEELL